MNYAKLVQQVLYQVVSILLFVSNVTEGNNNPINNIKYFLLNSIGITERLLNSTAPPAVANAYQAQPTTTPDKRRVHCVPKAAKHRCQAPSSAHRALAGSLPRTTAPSGVRRATPASFALPTIRAVLCRVRRAIVASRPAVPPVRNSATSVTRARWRVRWARPSVRRVMLALLNLLLVKCFLSHIFLFFLTSFIIITNRWINVYAV